MFRSRRHRYQAGPGPCSRATGQDRSALVTVIAADDQHVAIAALVGVARPGPQVEHHFFMPKQTGFGIYGGMHAGRRPQVAEQYFATEFRSFCREHAAFQADERDRDIGPDRAPKANSRVRIKTGRDIQGQHRDG